MEEGISTGVTLALIFLVIILGVVGVMFTVKKSDAEKINRFKHQK